MKLGTFEMKCHLAGRKKLATIIQLMVEFIDSDICCKAINITQQQTQTELNTRTYAKAISYLLCRECGVQWTKRFGPTIDCDVQWTKRFGPTIDRDVQWTKHGLLTSEEKVMQEVWSNCKLWCPMD